KTLAGYERNMFKKGPAGRLRKEGKIPSVIYGHNKPVHISVDAKEFDTKFHTISENTLITINVEDKEYEVLVKDFQENMMLGQLTHIDFFEVERGKTLKTRIPVYLTGTSIGVKEGGLLEHRLHEIDIECLPKDIPEKIEIDITELLVGESIHVSDLTVIEAVKILNFLEQVVVSVTTVKAEVEPEIEEEEIEGEEEAESTEEETTEE
ncbi:MAG: 50S ribosomal protein L25, partial [Spirochaetales bacterium]|nr:50S ribosomal protein L25 [Spirochaetales bacterium]